MLLLLLFFYFNDGEVRLHSINSVIILPLFISKTKCQGIALFFKLSKLYCECRLGNMTTNETGDLRSAGVVQVLDVGCGVASFSAYLLPLDIQTMSFAPKDGHENQIQFALERGVSAMILAIATKQLPYPSNSFEMVHCSRCRVDWHENGKFLYITYLYMFFVDMGTVNL